MRNLQMQDRKELYFLEENVPIREKIKGGGKGGAWGGKLCETEQEGGGGKSNSLRKSVLLTRGERACGKRVYWGGTRKSRKGGFAIREDRE